jgi:hypothetical protein
VYRFFLLIFLLGSLTGCPRGPAGGSAPTVTSGLWTTSRPVTSYAWFIDGRQTGGGLPAAGSHHVALTLTAHADRVGCALQFGVEGNWSDAVADDTWGHPTITMPNSGSLDLPGPTSILRLEEHTADGLVSRTRELFIN